jgi:hypothetical protein
MYEYPRQLNAATQVATTRERNRLSVAAGLGTTLAIDRRVRREEITRDVSGDTIPQSLGCLLVCRRLMTPLRVVIFVLFSLSSS